MEADAKGHAIRPLRSPLNWYLPHICPSFFQGRNDIQSFSKPFHLKLRQILLSIWAASAAEKPKNASQTRDGADAAQPLGRGSPCHGILLHPGASCRFFLPSCAPGCGVAAEPFNGRQVGLPGRIQGAASHSAHHGGADELCAARWRLRRCWHGEETPRR